ncbi:MAG: NAD(P)-dependent oxidoreductase [Planctomycetes bacterium]|nr:NAD(P)-dependent oxidoreductase [Planctomycetota bacterium]
MSNSLPPLGFIGLGIMGAPMAGHLLRAGHPLHVFSRTKARAEPLLAEGAHWCASPAEVARRCETLLINVTDTPDVEAVLFGPNGAADGLPRGGVAVDFSTIRPDGARSIAQRLAERGVDFLDAPVTGGQVGAQNATLTIMVGGDAAAFQRVRPIFERVGKTIAHVGPSGAGQSLKACNQILCAVNMIGVCEALLLANSAGLDPAQAIETLAGGAGGSWAWTTLGRKIIAGDLKPAFMIKLIQKDLRIVQDAAERAHVPLPGTALAQQLFRAVESEAGGSDLGTQAMIRAYERLTKLT